MLVQPLGLLLILVINHLGDATARDQAQSQPLSPVDFHEVAFVTVLVLLCTGSCASSGSR